MSSCVFFKDNFFFRSRFHQLSLLFDRSIHNEGMGQVQVRSLRRDGKAFRRRLPRVLPQLAQHQPRDRMFRQTHQGRRVCHCHDTTLTSAPRFNAMTKRPSLFAEFAPTPAPLSTPAPWSVPTPSRRLCSPGKRRTSPSSATPRRTTSTRRPSTTSSVTGRAPWRSSCSTQTSQIGEETRPFLRNKITKYNNNNITTKGII